MTLMNVVKLQLISRYISYDALLLFLDGLLSICWTTAPSACKRWIKSWLILKFSFEWYLLANQRIYWMCSLTLMAFKMVTKWFIRSSIETMNLCLWRAILFSNIVLLKFSSSISVHFCRMIMTLKAFWKSFFRIKSTCCKNALFFVKLRSHGILKKKFF